MYDDEHDLLERKRQQSKQNRTEQNHRGVLFMANVAPTRTEVYVLIYNLSLW